MQNLFQTEQNEALKAILEPIFNMWRLPVDSQKQYLMTARQGSREFLLELYVTSACNQKCSYCYLTQHGDELYPKEFRSEEQILKNLKLYLDYSIKQGFSYHRIDMFSGEIWHIPFGSKVLDVILEALDNGLKIKDLVIPTNFSFCEKQSTIENIEHYIKLFKDAGTRVCFSCSMDGLVIDALNRPFNNNREKTIRYYSNIFAFCKAHEVGFHPMIAAENIEYQKENYDSWIAMMKSYCEHPDNIQSYFARMMQLMVRNTGWTDDKIKGYLDWLNYVMEKDIEVFFKSDVDDFFKKLYSETEHWSNNYLPYKIMNGYFEYSCTLGSMLSVRLGDLAIVPCHRTSYDKFLLGKFVVENDQIVDIESNNVQMASAIYLTNAISKPHCNQCPIAEFCMKGCVGSQYETLNEPFCPIPDVCNLLKAQFLFLYLKHEKMGAFNKPELQGLYLEMHQAYRNLVMKENCQKWISYIQSII